MEARGISWYRVVRRGQRFKQVSDQQLVDRAGKCLLATLQQPQQPVQFDDPGVWLAVDQNGKTRAARQKSRVGGDHDVGQWIVAGSCDLKRKAPQRDRSIGAAPLAVAAQQRMCDMG